MSADPTSTVPRSAAADAATDRLRFGVLGTGAIAAEFTRSLGLSRHGIAEAVASRDAGRAAAFAASHGVRRSVTGYAELLADPDVDVVYVATPHVDHARAAVAAIVAGKHVLCEKPLTIDEAEALEVIDVARQHDAFLLEAFAYRFHPQTEALLALIGDGVIGRVRAIDITFSYDLPVAPGEVSRATANALAGGGILDVGCYCTSMASRVVATAMGAVTAEPQEVVGLASLDPVERTDLYAAAVMRFPGDIIAQLACGVAVAQDDHIRVYGSEGSIHVPWPCWLGGRRDAASTIEVTDGSGLMSTIDIPGGRDIFALEIDGVAAMLREGVASCRPSWEESLANMRTLDRWRQAVGVHYDLERG